MMCKNKKMYIAREALLRKNPKGLNDVDDKRPYGC